MSRRRKTQKLNLIPDAKYSDATAARFINCLMLDGRKSKAESIFYSALDSLEKFKKGAPLELFHQALANVSPGVEVRSRRVGGATYQVPVEVRRPRASALAIRWVIAAARARGEKTMADKLSRELADAVDKKGAAIKKREDTHKMAEANRAFSHYRW